MGCCCAFTCSGSGHVPLLFSVREKSNVSVHSGYGLSHFDLLRQEADIMTENELKKLRRRDLLEILLELRKENDKLRRDIATLEQAVASKMIRISAAGSVAEATIQLHGVFEAAQAACDQYEYNIRMRCEQMERETMAKCEAMLSDAKSRIEQDEKKDK